MVSLQQARWGAYLVARNSNKVFDVPKILEALDWTHNNMSRLTASNVKHIANLVNPEVKDFRTIDLDHQSPADLIEGHFGQLLESWEAGRCDSRHFYWEFCAIHPFGVNVNAYVGTILYNWCNHTTGQPLFPPAYGMVGEGGA